MKQLKSLFIIGVILFSSQWVRATITTATMDGDWNEAIWDNGVPGCFDTIVIPVGIQVDITSTIDLEGCAPDSIVIIIEGRLEFSNGSRLKLPCGSDVYVYGSMGKDDAGGGSSTFLEICGVKYWTAADGEVTGPDTFCDGGCPGIEPLPIELLYFTASSDDQRQEVKLYWSTASENNNDYFTVERSADGVNWEKVLEKKGAGNSSQTLTYSEIDRNPFMGMSYYRLKQTDFNGEYEYSPIVQVNRKVDKITVYPNPVSSGELLQVMLSESFVLGEQIQIYSQEGKIIESIEVTQSLNDQDRLIISTTGLTAGVYWLRYKEQTKRFIIK
ncbi:MAG: T9SS type A sorting domain-containing protein [Crocinitomicaceae bacterium]